ncbi:uncharacterized protein LOC132628562 [Lycium barbarum]|uniref:uncharacterized protein LOC132628562 n=1 Tax=Lycium barbarum TaxID=112863 RepID=UPI00293F2E70|nr:uncharacterized protein LOC132628562 [Lycium barbarum]
MLEARDTVEHEIWWEIKGGTSNVWYENWTKLGALNYVVPTDYPINEELVDVSDLIEGGAWNDQLLHQSFPADIAEHIKSEIYIDQLQGNWDRPWWMLTSTGRYTVNSAWNMLRHRDHEDSDFKQLCIKGVPFKIYFLLWRVLKGRIPTDDVLMKMKIPIASKCYCCSIPQQETIQHLFLTGQFATDVWQVFKNAVGIHMNLTQMKQVRYPCLKNAPFLWNELIDFLEGYKPILVSKIVYWNLPYDGWYKCNSDGASRGNPGPSSYGFCVRNCHGDLVYTECKELGINTSMVAKAMALKKGLMYCFENDLQPLIMETDSLIMKNVVEGIWECPWSIVAEVDIIKKLKARCNVLILHVYREGNSLAYFLTNLAFYFAGTSRFNSFVDLPSAGKRIINMDKQQIPNIRIRNAKNTSGMDIFT